VNVVLQRYEAGFIEGFNARLKGEDNTPDPPRNARQEGYVDGVTAANDGWAPDNVHDALWTRGLTQPEHDR
jgi:hypothetical protein